MKPELLPNICFFTKLCNKKTGRYFVVDGLCFNGSEVTRVGLLDLHTRIRIWRQVQEIRQLMLDDVLEEWSPVDQDNYLYR